MTTDPQTSLAASLLGKLGKGKRKNITEADRQARRERMKLHRQNRTAAKLDSEPLSS
jgi:hypothetical protein